MGTLESLMATALGWKCCCDIELPADAKTEDHWTGTAFSGKDQTGIRFEISLQIHAPTNALLTLRIEDPETDGAIPRRRLVILVSANAALKRTFRNYALRPLLPPRRILEWGPGRSTIFFAELFPEAEITGVEHGARWFERCQTLEAALPGRVTMHHRHLQIAPPAPRATSVSRFTIPIPPPNTTSSSSTAASAATAPPSPASSWLKAEPSWSMTRIGKFTSRPMACIRCGRWFTTRRCWGWKAAARFCSCATRMHPGNALAHLENLKDHRYLTIRYDKKPYRVIKHPKLSTHTTGKNHKKLALAQIENTRAEARK
jgi:hypothetical protein